MNAATAPAAEGRTLFDTPPVYCPKVAAVYRAWAGAIRSLEAGQRAIDRFLAAISDMPGYDATPYPCSSTLEQLEMPLGAMTWQLGEYASLLDMNTPPPVQYLQGELDDDPRPEVAAYLADLRARCRVELGEDPADDEEEGGEEEGHEPEAGAARAASSADRLDRDGRVFFSALRGLTAARRRLTRLQALGLRLRSPEDQREYDAILGALLWNTDNGAANLRGFAPGGVVEAEFRLYERRAAAKQAGAQAPRPDATADLPAIAEATPAGPALDARD